MEEFPFHRREKLVADKFNVSRGAVGNIKKRREEYFEQYEDQNLANDSCRKSRKTVNEEINDLVWKWFQKACVLD